MKYLPLYKEWIASGYMPEAGLCKSIKPAFANQYLLMFNIDMYGFWGFDGRCISSDVSKNFDIPKHRLKYEFTPLRQTVVLLMAAMNGEL